MLGHFSPSYPPSNPKNQNFERIKRASANVIFYTHVPRTTIIWCTCSLRQNLEKMKKTPGDIIILHLCKTNDDHMTHGSWDMERDRHIFFFSFWTIFALFLPQQPKQSKFWRMKKIPGDIILHKCTKNDNHTMYGSWDMKRNRQNFFVILGHFLPFYPTKNLEKQHFEKHLEISSFYTSVPKIMIIRYTVPEIWYVMDVIFIFHFALLPP